MIRCFRMEGTSLKDDGYVSTEYEGNRWVLPDHPIPEVEQVEAHQKMIKRLIREIEG